MDPKENYIVLFDGTCNLCNSAVQFIIPRDKKEKFRYASLQWESAKKYISRFPQLVNEDSIILYHNNKVWTKSSAALRIAMQLKGFWPMLVAFLIVPKFIRDGIYKWIASNRYKWFGKKDQCMIPEKNIQHLFLEHKKESPPKTADLHLTQNKN